MYHIPVLLHDVVDALNLQKDGIYVDATYGGGGHAKEILTHLDKGKLIGFDQDLDATKNVLETNQLVFVRQNFRYLKNFLRYLNFLPVDGILADLGVSSHQFDEAKRGFSIRFDDVLDMRMDADNPLSAQRILNEYDENKLTKLFRMYGEVDGAYRIAKMIVQKRAVSEIRTTNDLKSAISSVIPPHKENQFLAKIFQALRIEINDEINALKEFLMQAQQVLRPGGRLVVISYHSLEDRLVKDFMRSGKFEGEAEKDLYGNDLSPFEVITRKPIIPTEEEISKNNRARSAKLRAAKKR
ncbi:MAG: 16S rRNA (cytosine(1402)-N(4))-methyltransferase RsmH [Bacteroidetes bacterium]|nr:16S rRNA (cytosine(1402)-N(4))-methyltransferase RsmH [Bacteroidota bacterium]